MKESSISRRRFFSHAGGVGAAMLTATAKGADDARSGDKQVAAAQGSTSSTTTKRIPMRKLGNTGVDVSILGIGGGGRGKNPQIRGSAARPDVQQLAEGILHVALDAGVNYIDTCTGYGESERIVGNVAVTRRKEMFLATKCDRCAVSGDQLRKELEQSLKRLRTDKIDLWQIHNITTLPQVDLIFQKGRAIDVFRMAKEEGTTRFIGITVHGSARVIEETLARCRQRGIAMDTVLMSFNIADQFAGGHGRRVLENHPDIGKIAMKVLASDGAPVVHQEGISGKTALRYVLSHPFATAIIGTHSLEELAENIETVRDFHPYGEEELREIEKRVQGKSERLWTLRA